MNREAFWRLSYAWLNRHWRDEPRELPPCVGGAKRGKKR